MHSRLLRLATGALMGTAVSLTTLTAVAEVPESTETIKLAINEWTTQQVITQIAQQLLEEMGYDVESVTVGYYPQVEAMIQGDVTASLELWPNNIGDGTFAALDEGTLISLGTHEIYGGGAFYYPDYMDEQCPGLPDYNALKDCIDLFATAETAPHGRFLGYPADWGDVHYAERFAALGLDLEVIQAGGEGALIAEIQSAYERKAPLLVHFWEPHWVFQEFPLKQLALPDYDPACETDPAWGVNPDATWDCRIPLSTGIFKAGTPALETTWPGAYRLLSELSFDNADATWMLVEVDKNGLSQAEAAAKWISENRDQADAWIAAAEAGS